MEEIIQQVNQYHKSYSIVGRAHYIAWENADKKNRWLGIPVTITTAIIGTAIFSTIQENPDVVWKIIAGLLAMLATILSALQTTLNYSELAEKYKTAGANYAALRRRLELFVLKYDENNTANKDKALEELGFINDRLEELASSSPSLPDKIYFMAKEEFTETTG